MNTDASTHVFDTVHRNTPGCTNGLAFVRFVPVRAGQWSTSSTHYEPQRRTKAVTPPAMNLVTPSRASIYGGIGVLVGVLTNRLLFTPIDAVAQAQARSDILGVISGAALLLYGVGKAEVTDSKSAVDIGGVDICKGFDKVTDKRIGQELEWAAEALLSAIPNIKSFSVFIDGRGEIFLGRFREPDIAANSVRGGVVDLALRKRERAYLADMKTVPVKDLEFGFLPSNCQVRLC